MPTIDTLSVRFEADAQELFRSLDTLEERLSVLREGRTHTLPGMSDISMQLTVTADEAISSALSGAGETLKSAVLSHEMQFAAALQSAENAMAAALLSAADRLANSIHITVPITLNGQRVATATSKNLDQRALTSGVMRP